MDRKATITRKTKETDIHLELNLDGSGRSDIQTGIPFMDHMLDLFTAHGFLDLKIRASGDTQIDDHHTIEDLGICLGQAFSDALGDRTGIRRYGQVLIPMDEALARIVLDCSNRPYLAYQVPCNQNKTGSFDIHLIREFFRALSNHAGMTIHMDLLAGEDPHHIAEAVFKGFGKALDQAVTVDARLKGTVPSTKGML